MSGEYSYSGDELELFATAAQWKSYWRSHISGFLCGDVLEVGAGIGNNTGLLCDEKVRRWVCLEPDPALAKRLQEWVRSALITDRCEIVVGTLAALGEAEKFDSVIWIDVLEHIEDDRMELSCAADHLRPGGTLVVLAPAHQWLFSPFDKAVGHFRRYTKASLVEAAPKGLKAEKLIYLDSVGLIASLANRCLLNRSKPTRRQIKLWDSVFVPCSQLLDGLLRYSVGKSVLGVWRKAS